MQPNLLSKTTSDIWSLFRTGSIWDKESYEINPISSLLNPWTLWLCNDYTSNTCFHKCDTPCITHIDIVCLTHSEVFHGLYVRRHHAQDFWTSFVITSTFITIHFSHIQVLFSMGRSQGTLVNVVSKKHQLFTAKSAATVLSRNTSCLRTQTIVIYRHRTRNTLHTFWN